MAYLPGFKYDIFISYAHVDNLTPEPDQVGWIERFHDHLEILLSRRFGRQGMIHIWRDLDLDGSQIFDQTIQDVIADSALCLAITSNGYLESEYCRHELHCFHQKANDDAFGLTIGDRSRIFNVLLTNIPHEKWPEEYGRTTGFIFHDATCEDEFGEPTDTCEKVFEKQLRRLVDAICKTLHACKDCAKPEEPEPVDPSAVDKSVGVFFADVTDSLAIVQKRAITELKDNDVHILNKIPPPYEAAAHEQNVIEELSKAKISVHLLDQYPGREIEGEAAIAYPQKQLELALKHAGSQLIWVPKHFDSKAVEDENYKKFLKRIVTGSREGLEYDFIRSYPGDLTREILEKIKQIKSQARTVPDEAGPSVLVDTHTKDHLHAIELSNFLVEKQIRPFINPIEDNPRDNMDKFEKRLNQVNTLLFIYGQVAKEWVQERISAALRLIVAKNYPIKALGVYLAPPPKTPEDLQLNQQLFNVHLIDNSDKEHLDPQALIPLFEQLEPGDAPC